MKECNGWHLTDDDSKQYVKKVNSETFKCIELRPVGDYDQDTYSVYSLTVYLEYYSLEEQESYFEPYGYDTVADIQSAYGCASNQVIAECIFESLPLVEYDNYKEFEGRDLAEEFIEKVIKGETYWD